RPADPGLPLDDLLRLVGGGQHVHRQSAGQGRSGRLQPDRLGAGEPVHHRGRGLGRADGEHRARATGGRRGRAPVNASIIVATIGLIGSVTAVLIANRYTARTARRAAETTERMEERKLDASTWKDQYEGWREDALKLRELRDADQARYEQDRQRWEAKLTDCAINIEKLQGQMAVVAR